MIWVELDGGVCYELGDDSFLLLNPTRLGRDSKFSGHGWKTARKNTRQNPNLYHQP